MVIPSLRFVSTDKLKGLVLNTGFVNIDVAEYSLSSYLYLYPKHKNLSSKKESLSPLLIPVTKGAWCGGLTITNKSSEENKSLSVKPIGYA